MNYPIIYDSGSVTVEQSNLGTIYRMKSEEFELAKLKHKNYITSVYRKSLTEYPYTVMYSQTIKRSIIIDNETITTLSLIRSIDHGPHDMIPIILSTGDEEQVPWYLFIKVYNEIAEHRMRALQIYADCLRRINNAQSFDDIVSITYEVSA
jgi:hypothetical protein